MPARKIASKVEGLRRVQKVLTWMGLHLTSNEIIERLEREDGVGERQAREYIRRAAEEFEYDLRRDRPALKRNLRMRLRAVYQQAIAGKGKQNLVAAIMALKEEAKLDGLMEPVQQQVEHTGSVVTGPADMSTGARRARIAELMREAGVEVVVPMLNGNGHANGAAKHDPEPDGDGSA